MATNVESLAEFKDVQAHLSPETELIVLFFYHPLHEASNRMAGNSDSWSRDEKTYKGRVLFVKCNQKSSNQDIFEEYDVEAVPTYLFFRNNQQVAPPVTGSMIRRKEIETIMDGLLKG